MYKPVNFHDKDEFGDFDRDISILIAQKKGRDQEIEQAILNIQDAYAAYRYANYIIKGRWSEAEPFIMQDPQWAFTYAAMIIQNRWPEAEPYIKKDKHWWDEYKRELQIQESNLLNRLTTKLVNPIIDPDTHVILNEAEITDDIYNAYVKHWGTLDALPRGELNASEVSDKFGRLRPLASWPTKSTRALSKRRWDDYNRKLQTRVDPEKIKEIDPCDDPDAYLKQKMDDCMAANMYAGKELAHNKCIRQMDNVEKAIEDQCGEDASDDASKMLDRIRKRLGEVGGPMRPEVDMDDPLIKSLLKATK